MSTSAERILASRSAMILPRMVTRSWTWSWNDFERSCVWFTTALSSSRKSGLRRRRLSRTRKATTNAMRMTWMTSWSQEQRRAGIGNGWKQGYTTTSMICFVPFAESS